METEEELESFHQKLVKAFVAHLYDETLPHERDVETPVRVMLEDNLFRQGLEAVINKAVAFERVIMGQRAAFSLEMPNMDALGWRMERDSNVLTTGSEVGVVFTGENEDLSGEVKMLGSPRLLKWGDSQGQNLDRPVCLAKAFAVLI